MKSTRARADRAKDSAVKRGFDTKRLTTDAVLLAAALIIARLEALLPAFLVMPGFKPGLANIATLLTVRLCGRRDSRRWTAPLWALAPPVPATPRRGW